MSPETGTDPLVIRELRFLGPMATAGGWRPETTLPEIAFAGRSNVGKSSLLNRLVRRKAFARVSRTPGRTREINFFEVNRQFVLADLPGYGYARISKERRAEWRPLIEGYLRRANLPSRKEVLEISESLRRIEDKLDRLVPAESAPAPRPPRTRRPANATPAEPPAPPPVVTKKTRAARRNGG